MSEAACDVADEYPNFNAFFTRKLKAIASTSEARRLISQNAIKINSTPVTSIDYDCSKQKNFFLQIGKKKAYKISLKE